MQLNDIVLLCLQKDASLFLGNCMDLYDDKVGTLSKKVRTCFVQTAVYFSHLYSKEGMIWINSQSVVE